MNTCFQVGWKAWTSHKDSFKEHLFFFFFFKAGRKNHLEHQAWSISHQRQLFLLYQTHKSSFGALALGVDKLGLLLLFSATVLNEFSDTKLYAKNGSNFIRKWFLLNLFREMYFLMDSYKYMQKINILTILREPSIWNQWVCL